MDYHKGAEGRNRQSTFADEFMPEAGMKPKDVYNVLAEHKLGKSVIKEARRQLGIVSINMDGEQFWRRPKEGWLK